MTYPEPGKKYRHYKGGLYQVLFLSKHTENGEILVNYQSLLFGSYYSRPLDSWNELSPDGEIRFQILNDN
jgi:hypothetical protein